MPLTSRIIFYVLSVYMMIGAHVADWRTHLHSPRWPPHAKFHDGQTLCLAIFLGAMTCPLAGSKTLDKRLTMISTVGFASAFGITQYFAILYPGTAYVDPEYDTPSAYILGFHAQPVLDVIALAIIAFAVWLAVRRSASWQLSAEVGKEWVRNCWHFPQSLLVLRSNSWRNELPRCIKEPFTP